MPISTGQLPDRYTINPSDRYEVPVALIADAFEITYDEVMAPLLVISAAKILVIMRFDVKTEFLYKDIDKEINFEQSIGYIDKKKHTLLYSLRIEADTQLLEQEVHQIFE